MTKNLIIFILFSILNLQKYEAQPTAIVEFTRHGARGPISNTFDDTWENNAYGELTSVGMHQHFLLGKALLQQYPEILTEAYTPDTVYVRATDVNRTIMSAISQLSAIYYELGLNLTKIQEEMAIPPYDSVEQIETNLSNTALPYNWFIPPIHVVQQNQDYFLRSYSSNVCPDGEENTLDDIEGSRLANDFFNFITPTINKLNEVYGLNANFSAYTNLGDTLIANYYANRSTPGFPYPVESDIWNNSIFITNAYAFLQYFGTPKARALMSLPLYIDLLVYMEDIINGTLSLNYTFFSAHDTTLMTFLSGLNITTPDCFIYNYINKISNDGLCYYPGYASQIIIEMYNKTENDLNWYINLFYNDVAIYEINETTGYQMSYMEFRNLLYKASGGYKIQDYYDYCNNIIPINPDIPTNLKPVVYVMIAFSGFIFIVLIVTIIKKVNRRIENRKDENSFESI